MKIGKRQLKIMGGENMRPEYMSGHRDNPYAMSIVDNNLLGACLTKDIFISRYRGMYSLIPIFHNYIIQNYNIPTLLMNSTIYTVKNNNIMIVLLNSNGDDEEETKNVHTVSLMYRNRQAAAISDNTVYNAIDRCSRLEHKSIVVLEHTAGKEVFTGERLAFMNSNPIYTGNNYPEHTIGIESNIDDRHVIFGIKLPIVINGITVDIDTFLSSSVIGHRVDMRFNTADPKILSYINSGGMGYNELSSYIPAKYVNYENITGKCQSSLYKYLQLGINRLFNSSLTLDKIPTYRGEI